MSVAHRGGLAVVAVIALLWAGSIGASEGLDAGRVRFPVGFQLAGKTLDKGTYSVRVEDGAEGPTLVLSRDGVEVIRELAIVQYPKTAQKRVSVAVVRNSKDDGRLRLSVSSDGVRYLAFFEPAM